jgi:hypothetical protein
MKLSFDVIKSITVGALEISEQSDGVHFAKCTNKQLDAWAALAPHLRDNSRATTGIRFDFHTNSSHFKFTAASGKKFEIYVNDVLIYDICSDDLCNGSYEISLSGENRITLIFPAHGEPCVISSVELDDGAYVIPHTFDKKLLFIGDSITQGWQSGVDSLSYAYRVSRFFNADSVIQGVGGGYFHDTIFDADMDYDPDAVIVAFGTNDWVVFKSIDDLKYHANAFLSAIKEKYPNKKLIGLSPIWRGATEGVVKASGTFVDICDTVKELIRSNGFILIDGETLTPHRHEYFSDKNLHPNALGFGIYAETLIRYLNSII